MDKTFRKVSSTFELKDSGITRGIIQGTLINHSVIDSYGDVFTKESLDKLNKDGTKFLLHMHDWSKELGTITTYQDSSGNLKFKGQLDLSLNGAGHPNNPDAHKVYSLMKQNISYEMSAGGMYKKAAKGTVNTDKGKTDAFIIDEFELYEGSLVIKGAVPGAGVEYVKKLKMEEEKMMRFQKELTEEQKQELLASLTDEEKKELIASIEAEATEEEGSKEEDKEVKKYIKQIDRNMNDINSVIRKSNGLLGLQIKSNEDTKNFEKALRTFDFAKVNRNNTAVLIPELLSKEIVKDLKERSNFFGAGKIYQGQGTEIKVPVRDENRVNSTEALAEAAGNANHGELTYNEVKIGAGIIQNVFAVTDECRQDVAFDIVTEIKEATLEDFDERLALLTTNGVATGDNHIEGFMQTASNGVTPIQSSTAGTVDWKDLVTLTKSMKPTYRKGAKLYVSPDLMTEMLKWTDNNGRPLLSATQTPDGVYGYRFLGYDVIEEYYMQDVTTGKFPALFCNFSLFYAYFLRVNPFETEMFRRPNERMTDYYTRCRLGGKVIRPFAGALLQIS